jgi:hypothetical protein
MLMRTLRLLNVVVLSALVGSAALVYAQDEKQQEDKPAQQEEPKKEEPKKQDEAKPPRQDEAKPSKQDKQVQKQERSGQEHPEMQADHERRAGKGGHIPDDKFRAHFGQGHHFNARTIIVQGQPQFQYGGYTFEFVDAWPVGWAYTDDCYIDYVDGEYFLFDLLHPGVRIALVVVL